MDAFYNERHPDELVGIGATVHAWKATMKKALLIAALSEAGTGLALLVYPSVVVRLLFGGELAGIGVIVSRIAGISLIALGTACWPTVNRNQPLYGMLLYSTLAMLYLIVLAIDGTSGVLIWPAVVVHAAFCVLLTKQAASRA